MRTAQTLLDRALAPITLLTILPVGRGRTTAAAATAALFPAVGLLIGALLVGIDEAGALLLPAPAKSALVVVTLAAVTGALHLDGLADSADGIFSFGSREHRLEIMRDPRAGAFGVTAIAAVLLLKWAALLSLEGWLRTGTLLLVPTIARYSILPPMLLFPAARSDGLGVSSQSNLRWPHLWLVSAATLALSLVIFWPFGFAMLVPALVLSGAIAAYATSRLGGLTGDTFGAIIETNEALLLFVAATAVSHHWLT